MFVAVEVEDTVTAVEGFRVTDVCAMVEINDADIGFTSDVEVTRSFQSHQVLYSGANRRCCPRPKRSF